MNSHIMGRFWLLLLLYEDVLGLRQQPHVEVSSISRRPHFAPPAFPPPCYLTCRAAKGAWSLRRLLDERHSSLHTSAGSSSAARVHWCSLASDGSTELRPRPRPLASEASQRDSFLYQVFGWLVVLFLSGLIDVYKENFQFWVKL